MFYGEQILIVLVQDFSLVNVVEVVMENEIIVVQPVSFHEERVEPATALFEQFFVAEMSFFSAVVIQILVDR